MRMFDPEIWRQVTGGAVAERVRRLTRVTPLVPAAALGRRTGADVWLKLENLQRTGSFKLRGAAARLAALALDEGESRRAKAGGSEPSEGSEIDVPKRVIAASAGNHGLGVAFAAQAFGLEATVLVSAQTPRSSAPASPRSAPPSRSRAPPTTRPRPRRAAAPPPIQAWCSSRRSTTTT